MGLHLAIFEDDKDLADLLKEMLEGTNYRVTTHYSLRGDDWKSADMILGDFRNKIVAFDDVHKECQKLGIPLIAISGYETGFEPQLIKPFSIEALQATILNVLIEQRKIQKNETPTKDGNGFMKKFFGT